MDRGAIILCGGASSRMGRDKAWLPFGPDEVMLQRVVRLMTGAVPAERVLCVAAAEQELPRLPEGVRVVRDREPDCGPLSGLAAGLAAAGRSDSVFVTGCDVPLLAPGLVTRLFECLGDDNAAVPHDGQRYHPLSAAYRTSVLPLVESLLASGERRLVSLCDVCRVRKVNVDSLRDVDPGLASLTNCNTPDDYQRALLAAGLSA
jgi:molybdopterin-guanine dinucleotide biosynthesis protein A